MRGLPRCWLLLCCNVLDAHLLDFPVELERYLVVVVKRHRRTQGNADVEAIVGGEEQWGRYWHLALRNHFAVDLHGDVERPGRLWHRVRRLNLDLCLAHRELFGG